MTEEVWPQKCPECGAYLSLLLSDRYTYRNGRPRCYYRCSNFPACKVTHGADPDGRPLGVPADIETNRARMRAHEIFDAYWKKHQMSRKEGYKLMQRIMGMTDREAHIAKFTKEQCEKLMEQIRHLDKLNELRGEEETRAESL